MLRFKKVAIKYSNFIYVSFLTAVLCVIQSSVSFASTSLLEQEREKRRTFELKARELAQTNGIQIIEDGDNEGMRGFTYIPTGWGLPFAVLKECSMWGNPFEEKNIGSNRQKDAFISENAIAYNLNNIAMSLYVTDLVIKDQYEVFEGLIEEYCSVKQPHHLMPKDLSSFVMKYTKHGCFVLETFMRDVFVSHMWQKDTSHLVKTFLNYLDMESVHMYFAYVLLMFDNDATPKNTAVLVNEKNKLELKIFDTERAYEYVVNGQNHNYIFCLPFANQMIAPDAYDMIASWEPTILRKVAKKDPVYGQDKERRFWYVMQEKRIEHLQEYLRNNLYATPLDIMFFAFFKTPYSSFLGGSTSGDVLSAMLVQSMLPNMPEIESWKPEGYKTIGEFFNHGLQGYVDAMRGFHKASQTPWNHTLSDFMAYIPTWRDFKPEMESAFKQYVKDKRINEIS